MKPDLVLCVGMHRSGTSLTASLLQAMGLPLPGRLIRGDAANPSGYFENSRVVEAQEQLLQRLGYWWPTEEASHGLPPKLQHTPAYQAHVHWLTNYLDQLFRGSQTRLAIKDPRTSLLLPAWRQAADRLGLGLKLVICLRQPRDVCWSLVWRDGPSVGMGWSRAQRLWLGHYRALLTQGRGLPAQVAIYEAWMEPSRARNQLLQLAQFLQLNPSAERIQTALEQVQPELNHGGTTQLPAVDRSLVRLHAALAAPNSRPQAWRRVARHSAATLKWHRLLQGAGIRMQLLWLRTPWGRHLLNAALDPELLTAQLGRNSLRLYRQRFASHGDLRPHALISPAHLNRERAQRGLPPLRSADALFAHLLHPDLIPLNPHPWFDCRTYLQATHALGTAGEHPVLTYLRRAQRGEPNPYAHPLWLGSLGAARPTEALEPLPSLLQQLHPGLVKANPAASLGDPDSGEHPVIEAHEAYWRQIADTFALWPGDGEPTPLTWLANQPGVEQLGLTIEPVARGLSCWWLPGDWPAPLLASLAGADPCQCRLFPDPEALIQGLEAHQPHDSPVLLAVTPAVLILLLQRGSPLPAGVAILNLVWPQRELQSAWLHILAGASLVLEHRPALRAYLQGAGLRGLWCAPPAPAAAATGEDQRPALLLAMGEGWAEAQLSERAPNLDAHRYSAYLRLDAQLLSLGNSPAAPAQWLDQQRRGHGRWLWLNGAPDPGDARSWAVQAWAHKQGVSVTVVKDDNGSSHWLDPLCR
jgi:hypothetical protein